MAEDPPAFNDVGLNNVSGGILFQVSGIAGTGAVLSASAFKAPLLLNAFDASSPLRRVVRISAHGVGSLSSDLVDGFIEI